MEVTLRGEGVLKEIRYEEDGGEGGTDGSLPVRKVSSVSI